MNYLSVSSGVEAASLAWEPLGWSPWAFSEIEPAACAVLAHHWPQVPNLGDMTRYQEWPDAAIDVLVGGTPCQSFSVAGLRKGLADPRGSLMLTFGAIAGRYRPRWLVWENVPGVLSSGGGRDFGAFLGMLAELGYGFAYRVLDAQHFGVPQRRRRVFVVGHLGDWRRPAAVLFERHSLSGHPAPRRQAGQFAPTVPSRSTGGGGLGTDFDCDDGLIAGTLGTRSAAHPSGVKSEADFLVAIPSTGDTAHCLNAGGMGRQDYETETLIAHTLRGEGFDASEDGTGRGTPLGPVAYGIRTANTSSNGWGIQEECTHTLDCAQGVAVAVPLRGREGGATAELGDEVQNCLRASSGGGDKPHVLTAMQVRRLTPRECERLQGMPDDHTLVPYRGKPMADGPRYRMIGNSMAVPCMTWLGQRIQQVASITADEAAA